MRPNQQELKIFQLLQHFQIRHNIRRETSFSVQSADDDGSKNSDSIQGEEEEEPKSASRLWLTWHYGRHDECKAIIWQYRRITRVGFYPPSLPPAHRFSPPFLNRAGYHSYLQEDCIPRQILYYSRPKSSNSNNSGLVC